MTNILSGSQQRRLTFLGLSSKAASIFTAALGTLVLVGWAIDSPGLKSVVPGWVSMKANSALCLLWAGLSLRLLQHRPANDSVESASYRSSRLVARLLALLVALIGLITLCEYIFGRNLGIDQVLFNEPPGTFTTFAPGRMALTSVASFLSVGLALLLLSAETHWGLRSAQPLSLLVGAVGLLGLVGYAYGVEPLRGIAAYTFIALHTSIAFIVLSFGILAARPERGFMGFITADTASALMARRLLPAGIFIPLIIGWLRLKGEEYSFYDARFGVAMFALATIVTLTLLTSWTALVLSRAEAKSKEAETAVHESEERLRLSLDAAHMGTFDWDVPGNRIAWSRWHEEMWGFKSGEFGGTYEAFSERVHPEDLPGINAEVNRCIVAHEAFAREFRVVWPDQSVHWIQGRGEFTFDSENQPARMRGAVLETTARKQAERVLEETNRKLEAALSELSATTGQLWQASKLATMGELSASIAHELNNPLATVALRVENLLMHLSADDQRRHSLEVIAQEVDRMANLVDNLLQFSRRSHRQISSVDVREEIANSVEFVHYHFRTHKIDVVREFVDSLPTIQADRQQLRQLFLNLLTNASDAMPQGGKLIVRAQTSVLNETEAVQIDFLDTGEGIAAEHLKEIWDPFFTTKAAGKGTGLGLAICRRIVEEHGGTIEIESEIGCGAIVRMFFPATANGASANLG